MRKTIFVAIAALLSTLILAAAPAHADPLQVRACLNSLMGNGTYNCVDVSSTNPLPVTAGGSTIDPCANNLKTNVAIATSSASFELAVLASGKKTYICSLSLIAATAAVVNIVEGTGAGVCSGGTPVADLGSTTAASGMSLAANGGLTLGNGAATVIGGTTVSYNVCLLQSGTAALAGNMTYVQQ
jgi:hypothetical protein